MADGPAASPIVLRIKLRYASREEFIEKFSPHVGKSGLFLPTKAVQEVGSEIKFDVRIATDESVLVGMGRVVSIRPPNPTKPAAVGMVIELTRATSECRELIMQMLEARRRSGKGDSVLPAPSDRAVSALRADVESTGVREVPEARAAPARSRTPVARGPGRNPHDTLANPGVADLPPPADRATPIRAGHPTLALYGGLPEDAGRVVPATAPRTQSLVLAPEAIRRPRGDVAALIAALPAAAGANDGELDDCFAEGSTIDVDHAMRRAHTLVGEGDDSDSDSDSDAELDALLAADAVPRPVAPETSIAEASAELARRLGGSPVIARPRSAVDGPLRAGTGLEDFFGVPALPASAMTITDGRALPEPGAVAAEPAPGPEITAAMATAVDDGPIDDGFASPEPTQLSDASHLAILRPAIDDVARDRAIDRAIDLMEEQEVELEQVEQVDDDESEWAEGNSEPTRAEALGVSQPALAGAPVAPFDDVAEVTDVTDVADVADAALPVPRRTPRPTRPGREVSFEIDVDFGDE